MWVHALDIQIVSYVPCKIRPGGDNWISEKAPRLKGTVPVCMRATGYGLMCNDFRDDTIERKDLFKIISDQHSPPLDYFARMFDRDTGCNINFPLHNRGLERRGIERLMRCSEVLAEAVADEVLARRNKKWRTLIGETNKSPRITRYSIVRTCGSSS
jgi:hypothetical protein